MSKDNNGNKISVKVVLWGIGIIFFCGALFATVRFTTKRVDIMEPIVTRLDKEVDVLKTDMKYIKQGIDDIKERLR